MELMELLPWASDGDPYPSPKMGEDWRRITPSCEVEKAVLDIVRRYLLEMPVPLGNGGLSPGGDNWCDNWRSVDSNSLPFVRLGDADNRARRHIENGAWTPDAKMRAMLEFFVSGTLVFFVPEVRI